MRRDRIFDAFYREFSNLTRRCWFAFSADCVPQLVLDLIDDIIWEEDNGDGNDDG